MYKLIPVPWRASALTVFAAIAIYAMGAFEWFGLFPSPYRAGAAITWLILSLTAIICGFPNYYSPWRWVWRQCPWLNRFIFPDLNGVWVGTTSSNWPVIRALLENKKEAHSINLNALADIPLQDDGMALLIEADLFRIQIKARVANTDGNSRSLVAALDRFPTKTDIRLNYFYEQETPGPKQTDESYHLGAATLRFENGDFERCEGTYWTRRKWREGMNTAGKLSLTRKTARFDPKIHDLLRLAQESAPKR